MMLLRIWERRLEKNEIIKTQKEMHEIQLDQSDVEEDSRQKIVRRTVGESIQNKEQGTFARKTWREIKAIAKTYQWSPIPFGKQC